MQVLFEVDHCGGAPEVLRLLPQGWANEAAILDKLNKARLSKRPTQYPSWSFGLIMACLFMGFSLCVCGVQNLVDLCAQEARQCDLLKAHQAQLKGMGRQLQEALQLENDTAAHVRDIQRQRPALDSLHVFPHCRADAPFGPHFPSPRW